MRFLCFHGRGTNSQVLEIQLATLRYELGNSHTYEYVDRMVPAKIDPEIALVYPTNGEYYEYYNEEVTIRIQAVLDLAGYIDLQGPFDGVIGFSGDAALATTLLVQQRHDPPFQVAIFFSCVPALEPTALMEGIEKPLNAEDGPLIHIPTVHIWGKNDVQWAGAPEEIFNLCDRGKQLYVHEDGHVIPGETNKIVTIGVAHVIRWVIDAATGA